mmetsp:Transcript_40099/g.65767  ORF Transcript_40099/g.65767 Transcript_40099/m.65767 type:complete len:429 (-) Transcript_40099:457-1743(-)
MVIGEQHCAILDKLEGHFTIHSPDARNHRQRHKHSADARQLIAHHGQIVRLLRHLQTHFGDKHILHRLERLRAQLEQVHHARHVVIDIGPIRLRHILQKLLPPKLVIQQIVRNRRLGIQPRPIQHHPRARNLHPLQQLVQRHVPCLALTQRTAKDESLAHFDLAHRRLDVGDHAINHSVQNGVTHPRRRRAHIAKLLVQTRAAMMHDIRGQRRAVMQRNNHRVEHEDVDGGRRRIAVAHRLQTQEHIVVEDLHLLPAVGAHAILHRQRMNRRPNVLGNVHKRIAVAHQINPQRVTARVMHAAQAADQVLLVAKLPHHIAAAVRAAHIQRVLAVHFVVVLAQDGRTNHRHRRRNRSSRNSMLHYIDIVVVVAACVEIEIHKRMRRLFEEGFRLRFHQSTGTCCSTVGRRSGACCGRGHRRRVQCIGIRE